MQLSFLMIARPLRCVLACWLAAVGMAWAGPMAAASPSPAAPLAVMPATPAAPVGVALAQKYQRGVDLRAYWVSEKYDGVRALWDGQQLRSRQGLPIRAPAWFTQGWPATPLDGELWAGRGQFAQVQSIISQGQADDGQWRTLRYMVFDLPAHGGSFDQRLPALQTQIAHLQQAWVQAVPQWRVASHEALMAQLRAHERAGAEGLMLRRGDAPHRSGRSGDLLKVKSFDDAEAVVNAHLPGQGKYAGMTGALLVTLPDGRSLRLGSGLSEAQRRQPPPIGSVITYRYNGSHGSTGLPRFARFWRLRAEQPPVSSQNSQIPASDAGKQLSNQE